MAEQKKADKKEDKPEEIYPDPEKEKAEKTERLKDKEETIQRKKKNRKILKWVFGPLFGLIAGVVIYLGWLGFVPGLSGLLGADNPKDLGVEYTEADLGNFYKKTNQTLLDFANSPVDPETGKKIIFADPQDYDHRLTQEEITARINDSSWSYMPVENVQVRFGDNNRIEVSGNIDTDSLEKFIPFIGGVGYSQEDVDTGLSWLRRMAGNPAFYVDSVGTIENDQLSLQINAVQIGRWNAPLDEASNVLTTATQNALNGTRGLSVESATFDDGGINFKGTAPSTIYVKSN